MVRPQCPQLTETIWLRSCDENHTHSGCQRYTRGNQVSRLQTFLADYYDLDPEQYTTGYFGRLTRENVRRFQCDTMNVCSGSESTTGWGRVGPTTRLAILTQCTADIVDDDDTAYTQPTYYTQSNYGTGYSESAYYTQPHYYAEASYYAQPRYYAESAYYAQGTYTSQSSSHDPSLQMNVNNNGRFGHRSISATVNFSSSQTVIDEGCVYLIKRMRLASYTLDFGLQYTLPRSTPLYQQCTPNEPRFTDNCRDYTYTCTNTFYAGALLLHAADGSPANNSQIPEPYEGTYTATLKRDGTTVRTTQYSTQ